MQPAAVDSGPSSENTFVNCPFPVISSLCSDHERPAGHSPAWAGTIKLTIWPLQSWPRSSEVSREQIESGMWIDCWKFDDPTPLCLEVIETKETKETSSKRANVQVTGSEEVLNFFDDDEDGDAEVGEDGGEDMYSS